MANVSAPYNFVPLNEKVFFPPWANLVNHDVPFKDGLSGQIELEITAETPIFIRGKEEINDEDARYKQYRFPKKGDRYYIPGSSIKGEIANVLEIMSFSKLRFFNDVKYSQREWNTPIYKLQNFANVKGGWLSLQDDGNFLIEYNSNENPGRISHANLNTEYFKFSDQYANVDDNDKKLAKSKYTFRKTINNGVVSFSTLNFVKSTIPNQNAYDKRKFYKISMAKQSKKGTIVFTGQSSSNITGKKAEFIFWETNKNETINKNDIRITSFKTAYFDGTSNESEDWKMWKKQLNEGKKVPVFITTDSNGVKHFGLSMLYKLPFDNSIKDIVKSIPENPHFDNRLDFIQTLFGNINEDKLKGRVHFSHAFSVKNTAKEFTQPITTILSSPKPTYYPFYIEQKIKNATDWEIDTSNYLTFNDKGMISGRKRYPIATRDDNYFDGSIFNLDKSKSSVTFFPLRKDAVFKTKITFNNILPEELGGLLSAITFHNNDSYRHSLGMAKPLGLGRVKLVVKKLEINKTDSTNKIDDYLCSFENSLNKLLAIRWRETNIIKELFAIAMPISQNLERLKYLDLDIENNNDEFNNLKSEKKALPKYSQFMGLNIKIKSPECKETEDSKFNVTNFKKIFDEIKVKGVNQLKNALALINRKIENLELENKRNAIINQGLIINDTVDYGNLQIIIAQYKKNINLEENELLPENDHAIILKNVDRIYKTKKKKFRQSLANKIKSNLESWIGKEKATEWFNSKQ